MVQGSQQIRGGPHFPDRCPSTRLLAYNLFSSTHIRHPPPCPVHRSDTKFKALNEANVFFESSSVYVSLTELSNSTSGLEFRILCGEPDWELSALAQVCTSFPQALIPSVEKLYILESSLAELSWQVDIENSQWMELLRSFAAVKAFYLCKKFTPRIAPTLQELVGERVQTSCPLRRAFSWRSSIRLDLSRKALTSSSLHDSSPATP